MEGGGERNAESNGKRRRRRKEENGLDLVPLAVEPVEFRPVGRDALAEDLLLALELLAQLIGPLGGLDLERGLFVERLRGQRPCRRHCGTRDRRRRRDQGVQISGRQTDQRTRERAKGAREPKRAQGACV